MNALKVIIRNLLVLVALAGVLVVLAGASVANAAPRSQSEALRIAKQFVASSNAFCAAGDGSVDVSLQSSGLRKAKAYVDASPSYYIYNVLGGKGFVIVSGDDAFTPVLGYGMHGEYGVEGTSSPVENSQVAVETALPDGLAYWLDMLSREMEAAKSEGYVRRHAIGADVQRGSIEPLLTTKWNQRTPYNNLIPTFATGCVATAMAQVMRFWEYPTRGTGSHTNSFFTQHSADFASTTYDWANMKDEYGGKRDTREQVNAVATLMYHLGIATDMRWAADNSSTPNMYAAYALVNFFGYNKNLYSETRDHVSPLAWRTLLLEQLASGHPLCYSGYTSETSGEGHFFVCDGYDAETGKFHFNWGWGGLYDGYFELSALDPLAEGQAGALTGSFNYGQQVFVDVQPAETEGYVAHFDCAQVYPLANSCKKEDVVVRTMQMTNNTVAFDGTIGMALYDGHGSFCQYVPSQQNFPGALAIGKGYDAEFDVKVNLEGVPDGTYTMCLAVVDRNHSNSLQAVRAYYGNPTYYEAIVQGGSVSFKALNNEDVQVGIVSPYAVQLRSDGVFNLRGQRVAQGRIKKGVHVMNGKKIMLNN